MAVLSLDNLRRPFAFLGGAPRPKADCIRRSLPRRRSGCTVRLSRHLSGDAARAHPCELERCADCGGGPPCAGGWITETTAGATILIFIGYVVGPIAFSVLVALTHGYFNKSDAPARALFWVSPAGKLEALFDALHNLVDIPRILQLSAEHDVEFLPPEASN